MTGAADPAGATDVLARARAWVAADIGSGMGKLSEVFLARGNGRAEATGLAAACDAFLREHSRGCPLCALAPGDLGFDEAMRKLNALFDAHAGEER
jgi:hypothetical protein